VDNRAILGVEARKKALAPAGYLTHVIHIVVTFTEPFLRVMVMSTKLSKFYKLHGLLILVLGICKIDMVFRIMYLSKQIPRSCFTLRYTSTSRSILSEELIVAQLIKKFTLFYGI
jgi:hypothetical protein